MLSKISINVGDRFGNLTAVEDVTSKGDRFTYWTFRCELCGSVSRRIASVVTTGKTKSCSCINKVSTVMVDGAFFGTWEVIQARSKPANQPRTFYHKVRCKVCGYTEDKHHVGIKRSDGTTPCCPSCVKSMREETKALRKIGKNTKAIKRAKENHIKKEVKRFKDMVKYYTPKQYLQSLPSGTMVGDHVVVTYWDAMDQGLDKFFTGVACTRGHVDKRWTKYPSSCLGCSKEDYMNNKEHRLAQSKKWTEDNKERQQYLTKRYYENNRDKVLEQATQWQKDNPAKVNARNRARRKLIENATPPWADWDKIVDVYEECTKLCEDTGEEHHVDHIIPLQGKLVCGLHVHTNLQILTAEENLTKSNKFNIDEYNKQFD